MAETTGKRRSRWLYENGVINRLTLFDYLVGYKSPTVDINPDVGTNIGIPFNLINLYERVTIPASQLKTCGTTFVPIVEAPGAGFFIADSKIVVTRAGGGAAYGFGDYLSFGTEGGDSQYIIDNALFNTPGALNIAPIRQGQNQIENAAFGVTVLGGAGNDSPTGDKDIDVEIYYTIHATKS